MRILVTGATGFIGKSLWQELADAGHVVDGADIDTAFVRSDWRIGHGRLHHVDLLADGAAERLFDETRPQVVVHLAAQVGRLFGEDDWRRTIESNVLMTTIVANYAAAVSADLVYASTSEVYGDQGDVVCVEDGPLLLPHNLYGLSKRHGEEVCRLYAPRHLKVVRLSMPYGIGVPPGRGRAALNNVLWQVWTGQEVPIHIGAERSWCFVGDTVRGIRLVIERGEPGVFNVGRDDAPISMLALADRAVDMVDPARRSLIRSVMAPAAQTVVKRLSTEKLRALGWAPEVDLDEGMARVLEWVKKFDEHGRRNG